MAYQPVFPTVVGNTCGSEPETDNLRDMDAFTKCALQKLEKHCETNKCKELNVFKEKCQALADIRPDLGGFLPDKPFQSSYLYKKCNYCAFKHFMDDEGFETCTAQLMFHPDAVKKAERAQAAVTTSILSMPSSDTCINYRMGPLFDSMESARVACNASGTCVYDGDGCRQKVCTDRENATDCNAHVCEWNGYKCYEIKCENYNTVRECESDPSCAPNLTEIMLYEKTWNEPTKSFYFKNKFDGNASYKVQQNYKIIPININDGTINQQHVVLVDTNVLQKYENLKDRLVQTVRSLPPDMNKIQPRLNDLKVLFEPYFDTTDFQQHYNVERTWFTDVNTLKKIGQYPLCRPKVCNEFDPYIDCPVEKDDALRSSDNRYNRCRIVSVYDVDFCEEVTCDDFNKTRPPPYNVSCETAFDERVTRARCIMKDKTCVQAECNDMPTKEDCDSMNRQGQRKLTMPACSWKRNTCKSFDCQDHNKALHHKVLCQTDDRCELVENRCNTKKQ